MPRRPHPDFRPGPLTWDSTRALNDVVDDVSRLSGGFSAAAPLALTEDSSGVRIRLDESALIAPFWVQITAVGTGDDIGFYAWQEVEPAASATFTLVADGLTGAVDDSPLYTTSDNFLFVGDFCLIQEAYNDPDRGQVYVVVWPSRMGTAWVRILCIHAGLYGYPGLVQLYDSSVFPGTFSDLNGANTTVAPSTGTGPQTLTPASMDGISIGQTLMIVDGLCGSQTVAVTGTDATARGTATLAGSTVASVSVDQGGSGYTSAPSVSFSGDGSGASGTATISGGAVTGVSVDDGGTDYTSAPTVTFSPSPGAATSFTADFASPAIAYGVTGVTITDGGSGYGGIAPGVTFSGGSGSGATGTAVLDDTGDHVVSVTITAVGQDYNPTAPDATFDPPGSGTTATGTAVASGPITIYLAGVWVPMWPPEYLPEANDVAEPVIFLARREADAPDGIAVYLAEGGITAVWTCDDGTSRTTYAGRVVAASE